MTATSRKRMSNEWSGLLRFDTCPFVCLDSNSLLCNRLYEFDISSNNFEYGRVLWRATLESIRIKHKCLDVSSFSTICNLYLSTRYHLSSTECSSQNNLFRSNNDVRGDDADDENSNDDKDDNAMGTMRLALILKLLLLPHCGWQPVTIEAVRHYMRF